MSFPDVTNYYLFAQVIASGSISAASRELSLPKSTISRRMAQLEQEQGTRLFHRSRSGLKLTDVGREFLVHCERLVSAAESAQQVTQRLLEKPRGKVEISAPYALSQSLLVQVLPEFMSLYPEVEIQLIVTNRPVNLIEEGIDIALRVRPTIEDSSLIARPISPAPQTLYIAPALIKNDSILEPEDLQKFEHLSMHYTHGRYGYELTHSSGSQKNIRIKPRLISDDMIVLREAAINKLGIASLPNYLCTEAVNNGELVPVLTDWHLPVGIMHMTYSHRRGILPSVRVLIDFLAEKLPELAQRQF
ncbi:LysR family transcriptional regulator [Idiomarina ramblicola]|uniref:LysR family transcriptional regulator n=1 Tax=Idiomarina ramblicola TaxID=263724 RepID=A0A432Z530_9GAMM|nr:LysR family transcriptional regulator [Idiomarina ramblicola]RUO72996.1 LysR family transcriptional regulator [Idiomarina ramblicola]